MNHYEWAGTCFFETWRPERGSNTRSQTFQAIPVTTMVTHCRRTNYPFKNKKEISASINCAPITFVRTLESWAYCRPTSSGYINKYTARWQRSPSGWNRFQTQIDRVQNRGTFLGDCQIGIYRGIIRSKIVFFRISNISVPSPHAQLRGRTVINKLRTFFGPWGRDRSRSSPCIIFRVKQIHQSTASEWQRT